MPGKKTLRSGIAAICSTTARDRIEKEPAWLGCGTSEIRLMIA